MAIPKDQFHGRSDPKSRLFGDSLVSNRVPARFTAFKSVDFSAQEVNVRFCGLFGLWGFAGEEGNPQYLVDRHCGGVLC